MTLTIVPEILIPQLYLFYKKYIIMDDSTWGAIMLFLNKHQKSVFFNRNCKYVGFRGTLWQNL
jgi:hypothetical protein